MSSHDHRFGFTSVPARLFPLALLLAAQPLAAQGAPGWDWKPGVQVFVAKPQGDLTQADFLENAWGVGAGVNAQFDLHGGHAIVPRVDFLFAGHKASGQHRKFKVFNVGADYQYFFSQKVGEGFYLAGGVGYSFANYRITGGAADLNHSPDSLTAALGVGFCPTPNHGLELRYQHARFSYPGTSGRTAPFVSLGYTYRF